MINMDTFDPQTHENTLLLHFLQKKKRELVETIQMSWIHLNLLCIFATIISKGLFTVGKRTMAIFKPLLIFLHCVSYHSHGQYHL